MLKRATNINLFKCFLVTGTTLALATIKSGYPHKLEITGCSRVVVELSAEAQRNAVRELTRGLVVINMVTSATVALSKDTILPSTLRAFFMMITCDSLVFLAETRIDTHPWLASVRDGTGRR